MKYRISGGNLILHGTVEAADLLIRDGVIDGIVARDAAVSSEYRTLACDGYYVSPGFVDIHQHGGGGSDYMDRDPDAFFRATEAHLRGGTTACLPTLLSSSGDALRDAIERYKAATKDGRIRAHLLGLHVEGPYISPLQAGAQKPEHIRAFDREEYLSLFEASEGLIRRWSVAPEVDGAEEFAAFARKNGITLSIAHSNADFDTVCRAYEWGFHHVTHFYSCISTITRRDGFRIPGILEAAYFLDGMNVEVIADGCHLPRTLLAYVAKFKSHDRIALVTDAMRAAGEDVTESFLGGVDDPLPVRVEDGVAKLWDRSAFAGSVATADRLVRTMTESGVPLVDAVAMMTRVPIETMGLSVKKGLLAEGYDADLCVFDERIGIKKVICGGELVVEA